MKHIEMLCPGTWLAKRSPKTNIIAVVMDHVESSIGKKRDKVHPIHLSCWIEIQTRQVGIKSSFKSLNESLTPLRYKEDDSRCCLFLFSRTFISIFRIFEKVHWHKNYSHFQSLGWLSHLLGGVPGTCTATPADGSSSSFSRIDDGLWNWWWMAIGGWWSMHWIQIWEKRPTPVPGLICSRLLKRW